MYGLIILSIINRWIMILYVYKSCFVEYLFIFFGCKMYIYKNMFNYLKKLLILFKINYN